MTIDIMRAIAIVLVVIGHFRRDDFPESYNTLINIIYTFHMPLFIFISGFICMATHKHTAYTVFIKKKLRRLIVPYITTSIIVITLKLLFQNNATIDHTVTWYDYIAMFYSPAAGDFLWYIWALWWMMLLIGVSHSKLYHTALLVLSLITVFTYPTFTEIFCIRQFGSMWIYFMTGVFSFRYIKNPVDLFRFDLTIISLTLFSCSCWLLFNHDIESPILKEIIDIETALNGIFITASICYHIKKLSNGYILKTFTSLAAASYVIYLLHPTFESFARSVAFRIFQADCFEQLITFIPIAICVIGTGVIVPWFLYRAVLRRHKITRLLFGLSNQ